MDRVVLFRFYKYFAFFPTEKLKSKAENGGAEIAEYLQPFIQGM